MANYATLKAAIQNVVKTNGNNEITGALLQQSLLSMINSLGSNYQFVGVANPTTNPGTPDQNVFYIAATSGQYANFNAISLNDGEVAVLKYNGTWVKETADIASFSQLDKLEQVVTGKEQTIVGATGSYSLYYRMYAGKTYVITNNSSANASVRSFDSSLTLTDDFNFYLGAGLSREVTPQQDIYGFAGYVNAQSNFTVKAKSSIIEDVSSVKTNINDINGRIGISENIYLSSESAIGSWRKDLTLKGNATYIFKNLSEFVTSLILYDAAGNELFRYNNFNPGLSVEATPLVDVASVRGYSTVATVVNIQITTKDSVFDSLQKIDDNINDIENEIGISLRIYHSSTSAIGSWVETYDLKKGETYIFTSNCDDNTSLILYAADSSEVYRNNNFTRGQSIEVTPSNDVVSIRGYSSRSKIIDITVVQKDSLRDDINAVFVNEDILLCNPPSIYDNLIINNKRGPTINSGNIETDFSFLHFSDIHGNTVNLERIKSFYGRYRQYIDDIFCSGDIVTHTFADENILSDSPNILSVIGNHDAWLLSEISGVTERQDGPYYVVNQKGCYDKFFVNVSNWGVIQPDNAAQNGYCYYYKDYTVGGKNLRMVVLDCMHYNVGGDLVGGQSVQNSWLISVLNDARTNAIPVVIMVHYWPVYVNIGNPEVLRCSYTTTDYIGSDYLPGIAIDAVQTFINNGGEFVCWVCGHAHADVIAVPRDYPQQMFISIDCSTVVNSVGNSARISGTKSQDAFNIIAFDITAKLVKVVRVGSDVTRQLEQKRRLIYRYGTYTDGNGTVHTPGLELSA